MNNARALLLKIDLCLMLIDLKVILLVTFMFDFYRKTELAADIFVPKKVLNVDVYKWMWNDIGSHYVMWIPIVIISDFLLKRIIKGLTNG